MTTVTWKEAAGSRILGGHCGWSQDIRDDAAVISIEIEEDYCRESGETVQYRTVTYSA